MTPFTSRHLALTLIASSGCFASPTPNVATIICRSDNNCPVGYQCVDKGQPGGCKPFGHDARPALPDSSGLTGGETRATPDANIEIPTGGASGGAPDGAGGSAGRADGAAAAVDGPLGTGGSAVDAPLGTGGSAVDAPLGSGGSAVDASLGSGGSAAGGVRTGATPTSGGAISTGGVIITGGATPTGGTSSSGGTPLPSGGSGMAGGAIASGGSAGTPDAACASQSDPKNCGACGHDCTTLANVRPGATGVECRLGVCYVPAGACRSGFDHCSSNPNEGCETDLTGTANCGSCGIVCSAPTGFCSTVTGVPACSSSCVSPSPNLCGTKCVDLNADPANCGSCGHNCSVLPNVKAGASVQCVAGVCSIPATSCATGFGHCTGSGNLGCETTLNACGGCGTLTGAPGAACGACGTNVCTSDKTQVSCVGTPAPVSCSGNVPQVCGSSGELVPGLACSGTMSHCSGGLCYVCAADADCPAPKANSCMRAACTNHTCGFAVLPAGTACATGGKCSLDSGGNGLCATLAVAAGSFSIDSTEVTKGQYAAFLQAKGSSTGGQPAYCSWNTSFQPVGEWPPGVEDYDMPVGWVDWCDAYAYCAWAGRRLCGKIGGGTNDTPSECANPAVSQWMAACTGPNGYLYPYGNTYNATICNTTGAGIGGPVAVGHEAGCIGGYPGLHDMNGNLWELEDSCYAYTGATDLCLSRGDSYQTTATGVAGECGAYTGRPRQATDSAFGFRCCGP